MVPLKVHNVLDYVIGAVLVMCPFIFGFQTVLAARNVFLTVGIGIIAYSLCTQYRYSLVKLIPLRVHMALDVFSGIVLMLGPWLFDYRAALTSFESGLHLVLGLGAIALVATTRTKTEKRVAAADVTEIRRAA